MGENLASDPVFSHKKSKLLKLRMSKCWSVVLIRILVFVDETVDLRCIVVDNRCTYHQAYISFRRHMVQQLVFLFLPLE